MTTTAETIAIIAVAVIVVSLVGLYACGSFAESTGGYITNSTNGSVLFGWVTPIGSSIANTGKSWVNTAVTGTETLIGLGVVAVALISKK